MKCPKYIEKALLRRANHAAAFSTLDVEIMEFLEKNDIEVEEYDICGGCESYVNPYDSSRRILEAIKAKGEDK